MIKRYTIDLGEYGSGCEESPEGEWVNYNDFEKTIKLLTETVTWLADERLGQWHYMENEFFYEDKSKFINKINELLSCLPNHQPSAAASADVAKPDQDSTRSGA